MQLFEIWTKNRSSFSLSVFCRSNASSIFVGAGRGHIASAILSECLLIQFYFTKYICVSHFYDLSAFVGCCSSVSIKRKIRRSDLVLWQNPIYQQKIRKPKDNTQTPPKTSITQRLRTDLGRSVGVTSHPTGVVKPVYGYPTFPLTAKAV